MSNLMFTTFYLVGEDEEDAKCNEPFENEVVAASYAQDTGGNIFAVDAAINPESIQIKSPNDPLISYTSFCANPYPASSVETTFYLVGEDEEEALNNESFASSDAAEDFQGNVGGNIYSVRVFLNLNYLTPQP